MNKGDKKVAHQYFEKSSLLAFRKKKNFGVLMIKRETKVRSLVALCLDFAKLVVPGKTHNSLSVMKSLEWGARSY